MSLLNLICVSTFADAQGRDLPLLMERVMRYNAANAIRSVLLFADGSVMQVIEGESARVGDALQHLAQEPLHRDLVELNALVVDAPRLTDTSLGAARLGGGVVQRLPADLAYFRLSVEEVENRVGAGVARNLLRQFALDYR